MVEVGAASNEDAGWAAAVDADAGMGRDTDMTDCAWRLFLGRPMGFCGE